MKTTLKANIVLSILDEDSNKVYVYESWNPLKRNIREYLEFRGHKNYKLIF
tara:strand:+ start:148 stop:300 length:153 start_codon:yes stop_codon:yes gene_type:complete